MPNISLNKIRSALQRVHRNMHIFYQVVITQNYEIFNWKFFIWTSCRTFRDRHHLISNLNPLIVFFSITWLELSQNFEKNHTDRLGSFSRENFRSEEKSENSRELEWYYLDYVSRFLLGDVGNETMFIYCCLLFIVYLWTVMINALSKYSLFLELFHQF